MTAMSRSLLPERIALLLPSWRMVSVVFGGFASALVVLTAGHVVATPLVTIAALCLGGCVAYMLRARSPQALIVLGHAFAALCAVVAACSDEIAHVPTGIALAGITVHILVVIALTLWRRYGAVTTIARAVSYATLGAGLGFAWFAVHADIRCAPCQTAMAGLAITAVGWWRGRERGAGTTLNTALAVGGYMLSGALLVVTTILMDPWQTRSQEERFIIAYLEELQRTGTRLDQGRFIASWRARQGDGGIAIGSVDADYDLELFFTAGATSRQWSDRYLPELKTLVDDGTVHVVLHPILVQDAALERQCAVIASAIQNPASWSEAIATFTAGSFAEAGREQVAWLHDHHAAVDQVIQGAARAALAYGIVAEPTLVIMHAGATAIHSGVPTESLHSLLHAADPAASSSPPVSTTRRLP